MTLKEWLDAHPRGEAARIVREAGVSFSSIALARKGQLSRKGVAEAISAATGGKVPAATMRLTKSELRSVAKEQRLRKSA